MKKKGPQLNYSTGRNIELKNFQIHKIKLIAQQAQPKKGNFIPPCKGKILGIGFLHTFHYRAYNQHNTHTYSRHK